MKRCTLRFNQVDPDHAQEWLVGIGKDSEGIVSITNQPSAQQRWSISFHWRSNIAQKTFHMFGISQDVSDRNGNKPGRRWKDTYDEMALKAIMIKFNVLATKTTAASLLNIATKDGCHREYSRIFIEREIA